MKKVREEREREWTDRCSTNIWRCGFVFIADININLYKGGRDAQQASFSVKRFGREVDIGRRHERGCEGGKRIGEMEKSDL